MARQTNRDGYRISTITGNPSGISLFATETGIETALIIDDGDREAYYILNGDWHDKYEACQTLDDCKELFLANQAAKSM